MYIHEETVAGRTIIVRNHYTSRYHKRGMERAPNTNRTTEAQERCNIRKDTWELTIRLNANFSEEDYHITLTYKRSERPPTPADAKKDRQLFIRRVKKLYKEIGKEPKYIILTGYGNRGTPHHHLVISGDVPPNKLAKCWDKGHLNAVNLYIEDEGNYQGLAQYLAEHRWGWKKHDGKGRMWTCSKTIIRPKTKKWVVRADRYLDNPKPRKNYYVDKDKIREGFTIDGYPFQNYVLVRVRPPGRMIE